MEKRFNVVFTGRLHDGFKHAETVEKMVLLFQLDRDKVTKVLYSGRPTILKKGLSWEQARKYHDHLGQIGLQITIIEAEDPPLQVLTPVSPAPSPAPAPENPAPTREEAETVETPAETLKPSLPEKNQDSPFTEEKKTSGNVEPFRVEGSHGWLWIKEAFGMFFMQPLTLTTMMLLVLIAILIPIALHPYLGGLLSVVLAQIFQGGLILGAQRQKEDGKLRVAHLFLGFRHNFSQLLLGSFFYLLVLAALAATTAFCVSKILSTGIHPTTPTAIAALFRNSPLHLAGLSTAVVLFIPLNMGYWFSPCLTTLDDRTAFDGFRLSFRAVRINSVAFFIYALVFLFLGLLFVFLYGAIAAFFLFLLGSDNIFLFMFLPMLAMILLGIPLATIVPLSIYSGYKDIFHEPEKEVSGE